MDRSKRSLPAIILIEKDEITLELYQRELGKSFEVFKFTESEPALKLVQSEDIRAIVVEPELQRGNGWELVGQLRKCCESKHIPIIVCSTREPDNPQQAQEVKLYLTKPVLPRTLREKLLQALQNGKA